MSRSRIYGLILTLAGMLLACATPIEGPTPLDTGEPVSVDPVDLVGYWESARDDNRLEVHFHANGALLVAARESGRRLGYASGRWQLDAGKLIGTIESSAIASMPRGYRFEDEVVFVSDRDLILRTESGAIEGYQRVRNKR